MYAIVRAGGRQEKVAVGDIVEMDRVAGAPGDAVELPAVLLVDGADVKTDVDQVAVKAEILEHTRGKKIHVLRYKNKTGYRRRQGHRQDLTRIRITDISA